MRRRLFFGAIRPFEDINHMPEVLPEECTGCALCVPRCPGLAIFVVDFSYSENEALVAIPYEFLPVPAPGDTVAALDREGAWVADVRVQQGAEHAVAGPHPRDLARGAEGPRHDGAQHPRGGLTVPDRTIVCRCEDLTLQDIRDIIAAGLTTMEEVKRLTRCGMGPCQGRTCRATVAAEIARATGVPIEDVAPPTFRPPIKPVKLGLFLRTGTPDGACRRPDGRPGRTSTDGGSDHA